MNELQKIESFQRELALAETFEQIKLIGNAGDAYVEFMKRQGIGKDGINKLGRFLIEVDAKKGDWLNVNYPNGGDKPSKNDTTFENTKTEYSKMPATPKESARARTLSKTSNELMQSVILELEKSNEFVLPKTVYKKIKEKEKIENFETKKAEFNKLIEVINSNQIVIHGNSIEVLKTLTQKFDLLLTDPPYGMDFKSGWNTKDKIENDKIEDTILLFDTVLKESVKILKDDAHFYIFGNLDYLPQIKPIIEKYLNLKNVLIWDRQVIGMGDLKTYGKSYDIVYFGYNKTWKDLNGNRDRDVLNFNRITPSANIHPTEKPIDILEYLIKKSSKENDNILDPFAGGGSTLIACKNTNRMAIGIEINKEYCNLIKSRI